MLRRLATMLLGVGLLLAGCAAPTASPGASKPAAAPTSAAPAAPAVAASALTAAAPAAVTPAATAPPAPIKVRLASAVIGMGTAPFTVARLQSLFAEEGIELEWLLVQGGAAVAASVASGDIQFGDSGAPDLIGMTSRGISAIAVVAQTTRVTQDIVVTNQWAAAKGVTPQSPLRDRILALHGARMGITSAGGTADRYGRWLLTQVGLRGEDADNIRVGGGPEIKIAMRQGTIDGFLFSPPLGPELEHEGIAVTLMQGTDIPEWADFPHSLIYAQKSYAEQNREAVARVGRAVTRGARLIRENPLEATRILQAEFKDTDPKVLELSVERSRSAYSETGRFTKQQWENANRLLVESGTVPRAVDTEEGVIWTNAYLR